MQLGLYVRVGPIWNTSIWDVRKILVSIWEASMLRPGHTGPTDELRIDRDQIPAFARVLRDLDRLCVVVRVRTALIALKTR